MREALISIAIIFLTRVLYYFWKNDKHCFIELLVPVIFISLVAGYQWYAESNNIDKGIQPKTSIGVSVKNNWNNVLVTYNFKNIETEIAENIFAAQYEKYGQNLKELNILREENTYQLSLSFQDGTTKQETLPLK